ncbi:WbqC-like family protein [Emticicia oligotrophica DSM 17448]|uniref:WbqC-like family protein n=1 Tax=Emticicia oligotrophica (strain DSM 17448 / CIP 109782 / MTCC 6937 / GPTSA100-15) TaxID=929562 RepID=A0ABM5N0F9_EMTOG|nr:WbqC family protein [Emticicia oligotrophica]AFK02944.1 WbqC-like family protein [Emticicia oligotrophica DSM 17448]
MMEETLKIENEPKRVLGIMQPYVFPYIGYFQLIKRVDKFVIYDDVAFINKGWINRNNILMNGKASMFTIPLIGASQNKLIREIEIDNLAAWSKKFFKTLEQSYKKAPFYKEAFGLIEQVFNSPAENISALAVNSLKETCKYLKIETEIIESSVIYQNQELKAQNRILDICKQENANHYINPIGGMAIYDKQLFADNKILLNFIKSNAIQYTQFKNEFVPWLSIIDLLMFCSVEEINEHLNKFELV